MKEASHRQARIEEMLYEELATIVPLEMQDPRLINCTVTHIRLSPDLKVCRVYVDTGASEKESHAEIKALNHAVPFIRKRIAQTGALKSTPQFEFTFDGRAQEEQRIDALFRQLETERARHSGEDETSDSSD